MIIMLRLFKFAAIAIFFVLAACGPTKDDAINHNDELVKDQKEILGLEDNLIGSFAEWNYNLAKSDLKAYQDKLAAMQEKYDNMKAFDKEDNFRLSMIELIKGLKEQADNNYPMLLEFIPLAESIEDMDDDTYYAMHDLLDVIDDESNAVNDKFLDAQKVFAKKYDIALE
jgi:hypothetical protein